ncbi:dermonecrotic toxin domain-containing protein [Pseudomonas tolaasii]|uniref:dermonecrotic toxin domain-containing protein n=1 Tax=Pseudomonas tolaasii TaxID=29442 RepID=UPI00211B4AE3|nr:DUF6543 domain-containing protein [Pseudomonas tolaasii]
MADLPAAPPAATLSIHRDYLEQASPAWLTDATPSRRAQLKQAAAPVPDWYRNATPAQLQTLHDKTRASFTAQTALDKAMAPVQDIDAFAEPLLVKALSEQFKVDLDVHKTLLVLRKPLEVTLFDIRVGHFEVLRIPLLQAALHNFEEGECTDDAFDRTSGFFTLTAAGGNIEPVTTPLTVVQFTRARDSARYRTPVPRLCQRGSGCRGHWRRGPAGRFVRLRGERGRRAAGLAGWLCDRGVCGR